MLPPLFASQYIKIGGIALIIAGIGLTAITMYHYWYGIPVSAKAYVKKVSSENHFSLRFQVVGGEHAGSSYKLFYSIAPPPHMNGDIVPGKFDLVTRRVLSTNVILKEIQISISIILSGFMAVFIIAPMADFGSREMRNIFGWGIQGKNKKY